MSTEHADLVIRAGAIRTLVRGQGPQRALAVGADRVLALSPDPHGLDALIGPDTRVVEAPESTVLPAFERLYPAPEPAAMIEGLRLASRDYAASGIGTVRDAMVPLPLLDIFQAARDAGALSVRVRAMVSAIGLTSPEQVDALLDGMQKWHGGDDPWLRVWGVKFGLDGGLEAGATEEPYADSHGHGADFCGMVLWEPHALEQAVERVVRRGWRVGTHAYGDRAVRILLDVYERVLASNPGLPPGTLVMEHAGLAGPAQRARAVALGVPVTVQHPLLHDTAEVETGHWGPARVEELFPVREWIDAGALVAAGSDFPVGPYGAMISVWGMVTRQTVAGVRGAQHAVTRDEAIDLHTVEAARLLNESETRGTLAPGHLADYTIRPADPLTLGIDQLRDLTPTQTVLGGRTVHTSTA